MNNTTGTLFICVVIIVCLSNFFFGAMPDIQNPGSPIPKKMAPIEIAPEKNALPMIDEMTIKAWADFKNNLYERMSIAVKLCPNGAIIGITDNLSARIILADLLLAEIQGEKRNSARGEVVLKILRETNMEIVRLDSVITLIIIGETYKFGGGDKREV